KNYLQKLGIQNVATASSGQKALESARSAPPQVVLSALHLADMTGVQLAQRLRTEEPLAATGFVLITSQTEVQEANLQSPAGNLVRLHKPFDLDQLAQALAAAAGRPPQPTARATPADRGRLRVLVVDDSAAARSHIRSVLTGLGLRHIVEAADGAEAV